MFKEYKTIHGRVESQIEIKKSTFIGYLKNCDTEEEALDFIEEVNKINRTATHNCYAYIIGENKNIQRYNDDGEPQGTAGIPMLEVLKKEELTNICAVVTRYFGGVKLGASGLIRAYSKGVTNALDHATKVEMLNYGKFLLEVDYTLIGKIDNYLINSKVHEIGRDYTDKVSIYLYISKSSESKFKEDIIELTSANAKIDLLETLLIAKSDKGLIIEEGE